MITENDVHILSQQNMETLIQWWHNLNSWRWPKELPDEESQKKWKNNGRRDVLMEWITDRVGDRAISRYGNKDMSDDEFNDFWRGTREGVAQALKRHKDRQEVRVCEQLARVRPLSMGPSPTK